MNTMFDPINVQEQLIKERKKTVNSNEIIGWAYSVLNDQTEKASVLHRLSKSPLEREINNFDIDHVVTENIFHISQIRKI